MNSSLLTRLSLAGIAIAVVSLPLVLPAAWFVVHSGVNDAVDWVRPDFPARKAYEEFCADFGSGDVAVISWPGCTIDNPLLDRLQPALESSSTLVAVDGSPLIDKVVTGRSAYLQLIAKPLNLDPETAVERLRGSLVGPDGVTTCVFVSLTDAATGERTKAIREISAVVSRECQVEENRLHMAGPSLDAYHLNHTTHSSLTRFGGWSALITLLASLFLLRSLRLGLIVFGTAIYCQGLVLTLLYVWGDSLNAIMIIMPSLLLVLGVSGGVHLVNYYVESGSSGASSGDPSRALARGWLPCTLSAGTTAIGLASLLVSQVLPIRNFGWYGAVGMLITLICLLLIVPGACQWSGGGSRWFGSKETYADKERNRRSRRNRLPRFPLRYPRLVVTVGVVAMAAAAGGLPALRTSVRIDTLFHRNSQHIRNYVWIEKHVGPLVPVEVLLTFGADCELRLSKRVEIVRNLERSLADVPDVGGAISAATFLPPPDTNGGVRSVIRRVRTEKGIKQHQDDLAQLGYFKEAAGEQMWRVTARMSVFDEVAYEDLFADIHRRAGQVVREATRRPNTDDSATQESAENATADGELPGGVRLMITGISPLADEIQRDLMKDLILSFVCALTLIAVVMVIAQRSIPIGLAAMVPNVFPVVILFGTLGWLGVPVDIASVMTASLALGMAIDGTQHYVTFFRQELYEGRSVEWSVTAAFRHCSRAIWISAVVCGLGLLVFVFSPFAAVSRCATIMCAAIVTMTLGDLILLPSILMLTGRLFVPRRRTTGAGD